MKVNFKEAIGKVLSNKKLGTACMVVGGVVGAVGKVIQHTVEKEETKKTLEKLVNEKLAGK